MEPSQIELKTLRSKSPMKYPAPFTNFVMRLWIIFLACQWCTLQSLALPDAPGLYAVFHTSHGSFTTELHFQKAPRTVANFLALSEGSKPWLDLVDGKIRNDRFFDGLTFHRISPGFVIQGGSRNGLGTDGPGYAFRDEFHPDLKHDAPGILSMANSGPNSNGSQFFITLAATPFLDGVHSVFGKVVEGMQVVDALGKLPVVINPNTGRGDQPQEAPIIESIQWLRIGNDAEGFDPEHVMPPLPSIEAISSQIAYDPQEGAKVTWDPLPGSREYFFASTDLVHWSSILLPPQGVVSLRTLMTSYPRMLIKLIRATPDASPVP